MEFQVADPVERWFDCNPASVAPESWGLLGSARAQLSASGGDASDIRLVSPASPRRGLREWVCWRRVEGVGTLAYASVKETLEITVGSQLRGTETLDVGSSALVDSAGRLWFTAFDPGRGHRVFVLPQGSRSPVELDGITATGREELSCPRVVVRRGKTLLWFLLRSTSEPAQIWFAHVDDRLQIREVVPSELEAWDGGPAGDGVDSIWVHPGREGLTLLGSARPSGGIVAWRSAGGRRWTRPFVLIQPGCPGSADEVGARNPVLVAAGRGTYLSYVGEDSAGFERPMLARVSLGSSRALVPPAEDVVEAMAVMAHVVTQREPVSSENGGSEALRGRLTGREIRHDDASEQIGQWHVQRAPESSAPVYLIESGETQLVLKTGRGRFFNVKEHEQAARWNGTALTVPQSTLLYLNQAPTLVQERAPGETLRHLMSTSRWDAAAHAWRRGFDHDVRATARSYDARRIEFSTQTPALLIDRIAHAMSRLGDRHLVSVMLDQSEVVTDAVGWLRRAADLVARVPVLIANGHGDLKLEHIYWDGSRLTLIDVEFAGDFDIDWLFHGMWWAPAFATWADCTVAASTSGSVVSDPGPSWLRSVRHAAALARQEAARLVDPSRATSYTLGVLANLTGHLEDLDAWESLRMFASIVGMLSSAGLDPDPEMTTWRSAVEPVASTPSPVPNGRRPRPTEHASSMRNLEETNNE